MYINEQPSLLMTHEAIADMSWLALHLTSAHWPAHLCADAAAAGGHMTVAKGAAPRPGAHLLGQAQRLAQVAAPEAEEALAGGHLPRDGLLSVLAPLSTLQRHGISGSIDGAVKVKSSFKQVCTCDLKASAVLLWQNQHSVWIAKVHDLCNRTNSTWMAWREVRCSLSANRHVQCFSRVASMTWVHRIGKICQA